jgi:hypothetical protein
VITGGESGANLGGWNVARAPGLATGGWTPGGILTEEGLRPEHAELYGPGSCAAAATASGPDSLPEDGFRPSRAIL